MLRMTCSFHSIKSILLGFRLIRNQVLQSGKNFQRKYSKVTFVSGRPHLFTLGYVVHGACSKCHWCNVLRWMIAGLPVKKMYWKRQGPRACAASKVRASSMILWCTRYLLAFYVARKSIDIAEHRLFLLRTSTVLVNGFVVLLVPPPTFKLLEIHVLRHSTHRIGRQD